jgi:type I restriction enzyme S subunit
MREMKDSGIEWIGMVPAEWSIKPIRAEFCEVTRKNTDGKEKEALKFTYGKIVRKDNFDSDEDTYVSNTIVNYTVVTPGTIILNGLNLNFDFVTQRIGLVQQTGVITSAYLAFKPSSGRVLPEFATYLFKSYDACRAFHNMGGGVRKILNFSELKKYYIVYPGSETQKCIVEYLDIACQKIDSLAADIQAQIDTLEAYKRSVITEAVTKGLNPDVEIKESGIEWIGEIPDSWGMSKIKYVCAFSPSCKTVHLRADTLVGYAPMECIKNGYFVNRTEEYGKIPISLTPFEDGDIVMAKVTPCFENGNISIMENIMSGIGFGSSELFVFRPKKVDKKYLLYWLRSSKFVDAATATMTGMGGLKRVSPQFVQNAAICQPPISEQRSIVTFLDMKCSEIDSIIAAKKEQLTTLADYKKSLIYEYVTGKKEVPQT